MRILGVIPARYASSRLPGKPLADIGGKPLIERVYTQASQADSLTDLTVATDDERIYQAVKAFGGKVTMTRQDHMNGTSRLIEVAENLPPFDAYINIQGDEPFISPRQIDEVCQPLIQNQGVFVSTLIKRISNFNELNEPSIIKVVIGRNQRALYFSRSSIPFVREKENFEHWAASHGFFKHIGIYGFTASALEIIRTLEPSALELAESLEQLRWMENGIEILTGETREEAFSVDTPHDLEAARKHILKHER
ncbi:MAG: 3-deoxy-manno-octulosonate cytidylyltransferase [Bacteroidia bacterium]|nr:3-deoxy-manno-octulosonate cytidylyltransferase [Bacteroidia bacterium]